MKQQDTWNAALYDAKHTFVSQYGNECIALLQPQQGEHILDIGCGTGDLAQAIYRQGAQVTGIDFSANMVAQAQAKYPHIAFAVADATNLPYVAQFDAVFSNATLHWIKTPERAIQQMYNSLKQGGRLVAEFGGAGNVQHITDELIRQIRAAHLTFTEHDFPWYFPTIGAYTSLLEAAGFHVQYAVYFDRPTQLLGEDGLYNWLHMFSPTFFNDVAPHIQAAIFERTVEQLRPKLYTDSWYADYKRIRIVAKK